MEQKIKDLRIEIDGIAQLAKGLKGKAIPTVSFTAERDDRGVEAFTMTVSKECHECYSSLIFAKAHLGTVLGVLNADTPYKNDGKRKTVDDIEPTADKAQMPPNPFPEASSHVEKVDFLRQRIKDLANQVDLTDTQHPLWPEIIPLEQRTMHFIFNAFNHLTEARFWLGFELERIREEDILKDR